MKKILLIPALFLALYSCVSGPVTTQLTPWEEFPLSDSDFVIPIQSYLRAAGHFFEGEVVYYNTNGFTYGGLVMGDDIYVVGRERFKPYYWKNGERISLGDSGMALSITTDGFQIIIGGCLDKKPCLWIDGEPNILSQEMGMVTNVVFRDGLLYAAGNFLEKESFTDRLKIAAFYLKDDEIHGLRERAMLYALDVYDGDLLLGGEFRGDELFQGGPAVWKNGERFPVSLHGLDSLYPATVAFISGSFYAAGEPDKSSTPLKNGPVLKDGEIIYVETSHSVKGVFSYEDEPVYLVSPANMGTSMIGLPMNPALIYRGMYYQFPEFARVHFPADFRETLGYFE